MSVATAVYDQTCSVCETVKKYFFNFYYDIQRGKQLAANQEIYRMHMWQEKDKDYYLTRMNEHTNKEYDLKIQKLWNTPIEYDGL